MTMIHVSRSGGLFVHPNLVARAKEWDLLSYLQTFEPHELVRVSATEWSTRTHDSLKISNGMWRWFSRGISGKTALDYLIHVKGMSFQNAVLHLTEDSPVPLPAQGRNPASPKDEKERLPFRLPLRHSDNRRAYEYLLGRGIDRDLINICVNENRLYEGCNRVYDYHNVVFVGFDEHGVAKYAMERGVIDGYRRDVPGSEKQYGFALPASPRQKKLLVFEAAIDLLSQATMEMRAGKFWRSVHRVATGGVGMEKSNSPLPLALAWYLSEHPEIRDIGLCLDNDLAGNRAAEFIQQRLEGSYTVERILPPTDKDFNDALKASLKSHPARERGDDFSR